MRSDSAFGLAILSSNITVLRSAWSWLKMASCVKCPLSRLPSSACPCGRCEEYFRNAQLPIDRRFIYHRQLGEGTFGRVYLVSLKELPHVNYALKVLNCITKPKHIAAELRVMRKLGGKCGIMGLLACERVDNRIFVLMEYVPHEKFKTFVGTLTGREILHYMANLMRALAYLHENGVVHRDVKPGNYLYSMGTKQPVLTDFGLVANVDPPAQRPPGACATRLWAAKHAAESNNAKRRHSQTEQIASPNDEQMQPPPAKRSLFLSRMGMNDTTLRERDQQQRQEIDKKVKSALNTSTGEILARRSRRPTCECATKPVTCDLCEERTTEHCNKAGTAGYRAPETLLRSQFQDAAVDVWAAGMILLSLLSGRYPLIRPDDDQDMLLELAMVARLRGMRPVLQLAAELGKNVSIAPTPPDFGVHLRRFAEFCRRTQNMKLKKHHTNSNNPNLRTSTRKTAATNTTAATNNTAPAASSTSKRIRCSGRHDPESVKFDSTRHCLQCAEFIKLTGGHDLIGAEECTVRMQNVDKVANLGARDPDATVTLTCLPVGKCFCASGDVPRDSDDQDEPMQPNANGEWPRHEGWRAEDRLSDLEVREQFGVYVALYMMLQVCPNRRWTAASAAHVFSNPLCVFFDGGEPHAGIY